MKNDGHNNDLNESRVEIQAVERFVVDNDELLELEELIGRFNIFDALRIVQKEVKHSDFLAYLLDPNESHGQGGLFLRALLMDLFKTAREHGFDCPISPIDLDGEDLRKVEIRREWKNIDLLIKCDQPQFVVAIENKVWGGEHSDQLARYTQTVNTEFDSLRNMYVFLTVEGEEPSEKSWVPYSYADLHRVFSRLRNTNKQSIGHDVLVFLEHYLRLVMGRLMDDQTIVTLCQRIYKNHRQALELIYKYAGSPAAGLLGKIEETIATHPGGWHIVNKTGKAIIFTPKEWPDLFPRIGSRATFDPRCWVVLKFEVRKDKCFFGATVWPTTDLELRRQVVQRLTRDPKEFGFRILFKRTTRERWTQLGRESIGKWSDDTGPDEDAVIEAVSKKLDALRSRLNDIPNALRPIFDDSRKSHK